MKFDYQHLAALSAILRLGSFEAAAADLNVTQSAISQRLKALEEHAGGLLVHRGQPCTGTSLGLRFMAHADHVGLLEQKLRLDLGEQGQSSARVKIAVNADSLATWFLPAIAKVPNMMFDLVIDDQDHSVEQLRRGEVAAAVTAHAAPIAGCDSHSLGKLTYLATASPAYMAKHLPNGITPDALAKAPMLRFDAKDRLQTIWLETFVDGSVTPPFHSLASSQGFVDASLLGLGWGTNPEPLVRHHIDAGNLVELTPNAHLKTPLYWQCSRLLKNALKPLTKAVCQTARKSLPQ